MSVICQNFVQNAWRKDLCSNCFKCEADHSDCGHRNPSQRIGTGRYIPQATSLYQSRTLTSNIHWRPLLGEAAPKLQDRISCRDFGSQTAVSDGRIVDDGHKARSILKDSKLDKKDRGSSVVFVSEDPLVIGYGGRDYDSDDSPWEMGSDDGSINLDLLDLTEEDRTITKLTKNNTEFNSINDNLKPTESENLTNGHSNKLENQKITPTNFTKSLGTKPENYFYFSEKDELVDKCHLPAFNEQKNYLNSCKEMSLIQKDIPGIINSIQNNNNNNNNNNNGCLKLDNMSRTNHVNGYQITSKEIQESQLKSSPKYLLVTKVQDSCGSDSDYSTSKQTNGESSTDSESFHDAEESLVVPCSSFLHGNVSTETLVNIQTYTAKPFETSSISSADISTLSDDSDSPKLQETNKHFDSHSKTILVTNKVYSDSTKNSCETHKQEVKVIQNKNLSCRSDSNEQDLKNSHSSVQMKTYNSVDIRKDVDATVSSQTANLNTNYNKHQLKNNNSSQVTIANEHLGNSTAVNKNKYSNDVGIIDKNTKVTYEEASRHTENLKISPKSTTTNTTFTPKQSSIPIHVETPKIPLDTQPRRLYDKNEECKKWIEQNDEWKNNQQNSEVDVDINDDNNLQETYSVESNSSSTKSSPTSRSNRESKLAALALELQQARCDTSAKVKPPKLPEAPPYPSTRVKPNNTHRVEDNKVTKICLVDVPDTTCKYPSIRRGRSLNSNNQPPKSSLPDLLAEPSSKIKKGRFSLKKLLKRSKDSDTLVINNVNDYNPKAWKRQTFDRSRLSLEIIHPMDLTSDPSTSTDSTPTEEKRNSISVFSDPSGKRFGTAPTTRARSLSALPQLSSCLATEIGDPKDDRSTPDRPRLDMPRKAGTVAERSKKYKAPRRTPSFSELTSTSPSGRSTDGGAISERPPKPPPPPRGKSLPPPPPSEKPVAAQSATPTRPPPPKVPEGNNGNLLPPKIINKTGDPIGDYANLGDIRLNITPKKPQRPSAVTFALEVDSVQPHQADNTYESLETHDEEDHYTYVDEMEKSNALKNRCTLLQESESEKKQCQQRPSMILKKPWLNLHASYAAIAAANYESLAELITTAISEGLEQFQKTSLRWSDFDLESDDPVQILEDKIVYNAVYKSQTKTKVTLMVTTQKQHSSQNGRNTYRLPVLATFSDCLPKQYMNTGIKHPNYTDSTKAMVYVLQRSKTTTVNQFAQDSACFQTNQHVHLRNACFVLLQLIHTLKGLQAEGIEEIDYDLGRILLLHTDVDKPPILVLLPGDKVYLTKTDFYKADVAVRKTTLCQTTLHLLFHLLQIKSPGELESCVVNGESLALPVAHTFQVISKILADEKASSLTQAKGLLEYMLWGPVDIKTSGTDEDVDVILQRWLDLQRAQMVKMLVSNLHLKISSHTGFHVYEEYQLIFLLQATVKSLKDIIVKL